MEKYFENPVLIDVDSMSGDLVRYIESRRDDGWELTSIKRGEETVSEGIIVGQEFKSVAHKILLTFDIMGEGEKIGEITEYKKSVYTKEEVDLVINKVKELLGSQLPYKTNYIAGFKMREYEEKIRKQCDITMLGFNGTETSKEQILNQIFGIVQGVGFILGDENRYWYKIYEEYEGKLEK